MQKKYVPSEALADMEAQYDFLGENVDSDVGVKEAKQCLKVLQEGRLTSLLVYNLPGKKEDRKATRKVALSCLKEAKECGATLLPAVHEMIVQASKGERAAKDT